MNLQILFFWDFRVFKEIKIIELEKDKIKKMPELSRPRYEHIGASRINMLPDGPVMIFKEYMYYGQEFKPYWFFGKLNSKGILQEVGRLIDPIEGVFTILDADNSPNKTGYVTVQQGSNIYMVFIQVQMRII